MQQESSLLEPPQAIFHLSVQGILCLAELGTVLLMAAQEEVFL